MEEIVEYDNQNLQSPNRKIIVSVIDAISEMITEQPTAFDVDNIIKQLEELGVAEYDDSDEEPMFEDAEEIYDEGRSQGRFEAFWEAIKIVKGAFNGQTD